MSSVQNVVSTSNFGCTLDLSKIAHSLCSVSYNPTKFAAVVLRHRSPHGTLLIFHSGKFVITGAKSVEDCGKLAKIVGRKLRKLGFAITIGEIKTQLVVGSFNLGWRIDIAALQKAHSTCAILEPELFSAVVYRFDLPPRICALIFHTGKGILTGAKEEWQIDAAYQTLLPTLQEHAVKHV